MPSHRTTMSDHAVYRGNHCASNFAGSAIGQSASRSGCWATFVRRRCLHRVTETEIGVECGFGDKDHIGHVTVLLRPQLHHEAQDGWPLQGVFPLDADDGALLLCRHLGASRVPIRFRDNRPSDPALGFVEGELFHRYAPAVLVNGSGVLRLRQNYDTLRAHPALPF
jgi:hypothetical protein